METPIFNIDLIKHPKAYNMDMLRKNINHLSIKTILTTQVVDADFCVTYILNIPIDSGDEDSYICENEIMNYQPHITVEQLEISKKTIFGQ